MTATAILESLAREFSAEVEHLRNVFEMLDAGLSAPYIGRIRRVSTGGITETSARRVQRRRAELEELDRRRGTILRALESNESVTAREREEIERCMDRFVLEDLFIPHRRPEPEVQLAVDRGLDDLADRLVEAMPKADKSAEGETEASDSDGDSGASAEAASTPSAETAAPAEEAAPVAVLEEAPSADSEASEADSAEASETTEAPETTEDPAAEVASEATGEESAAPAETPSEEAAAESAASAAPIERVLETVSAPDAADNDPKVEITPELARLCVEAVNPDRGVHTEEEALAGAMRILSDRLGRSPKLRGTLRRLLRKNAILSVRPTVDESQLRRHKSLLKLKQPLRQIQGHRLLSIRQAQKERVLTTSIDLDRKLALPKVRAALGRHTRPEFDSVLDVVARQALERRLLPMLEEDIRLELKERADQEALRFLSQHLRQILLAPFVGRQPVAGLDVNAKGDWTIVALNEHGEPVGEELRIELGEKRAADLGLELSKALGPTGAKALAVGHGKQAREAVVKLRGAIAAVGGEAVVYVVNEAGLSSYANSELARTELAALSVPARMAASLGRRLQDPLLEVLKVDPRHLGLGSEQGLVSKANLKRALRDTIESCVAHVGCDVNRAPLSFLRQLPGLNADTAKKLVERRAQKPFESREELRSEGLMSESEWASSVSFLRVWNSPEPLDRTSLHPDQYTDARRIIEATGGSVQEVLGKRGATKGMRRVDFDIDEDTWRDLMREIAAPGRDPRMRLVQPRLLDPNTDAATLQPGQELEGIVSNVASFGAFIDLGLKKEGMVHISEVSDRYVRDARELLAIGQVIRAAVVDPSAQRIALSLKKASDPFMRGLGRPARPGGRGGAGGGQRDRDRGHGGGGGGQRRGGRGRDRDNNELWPSSPAVVRAAQERRDGMAGTGRNERRGGKPRGRGGPGGGPGGGGGQRHGGPGGRGGRGGRRGQDEAVDRKALAQASSDVSYNPFAKFFKGSEPEQPEPKAEAKPEPKPKAEAKPETPVVEERAETPAPPMPEAPAPEPSAEEATEDVKREADA